VLAIYLEAGMTRFIKSLKGIVLGFLFGGMIVVAQYHKDGRLPLTRLLIPVATAIILGIMTWWIVDDETDF
jgi:hypothetical protein